MKLKDLTGQTFTYLTVIERAENSPSGGTRWRCKCKCGNEVIAWSKSLLDGNSKSCGCYAHETASKLNTKNLIGQKFGKLTVLNKTHHKNRQNKNIVYWICQCECGNIVEVQTGNLKSGNVKSCGCYRNELLHQVRKTSSKYKDIKNHLRWNVDLEFLESFDDIEKLKILNKCICKAPSSFTTNDYKAYLSKFYYDKQFNYIYHLYLTSNKKKYAKPSLDHIKPLSTGGTWELNNLQFLTWAENRAKFNYTQEEWNEIREKYFIPHNIND